MGNLTERETDNRGPALVSDYCADSLHIAVKEAWLFEGCTDTNTNGWNKMWESILCNSYDSVDKACGQDLLSGSTAVVVLVSACQIVVANCGDSRAVLCRGSHTIALTNDHKPTRSDEEERIIKNGGNVVEDRRGVMRVDGVLAMTRAIGDYSMKPYVSAVPELSFSTRSEEDECLIIASDGLWDVIQKSWVISLLNCCKTRVMQQQEAVTRPHHNMLQIIFSKKQFQGGAMITFRSLLST